MGLRSRQVFDDRMGPVQEGSSETEAGAGVANDEFALRDVLVEPLNTGGGICAVAWGRYEDDVQQHPQLSEVEGVLSISQRLDAVHDRHEVSGVLPSLRWLHITQPPQ